MMHPRRYIKGTTIVPTERNWGGRPAIYKHYEPDADLYYKKEDKHYCVVDDLPSRGFVLSDGIAEWFLPHDFFALVSYEEAAIMCNKAGIFLPKPTHPKESSRVPPPLFQIKTPSRTQSAWNVSAILRHIDESLKRKNA